MSRTAQAVRSALWVMLESWTVRLITFLAFVVLARLLTPKDFGLMALAGVYLSLCSFIIDQGFGTAVMQREDLKPDHLDAAFWTQLALGAAIGLITIAAAEPVARWFAEPDLTRVLQVMAPFPLMTALSLIQQAQLKRDFRFGALALRHVVSAAAGAVLGVAMAAFGYGVWSLVAQMQFGAVVAILILWRASPWRPRLSFSLRHFRELARFGSAVFAYGVAWMLTNQVDRILLGRIAGAGPLGLYTVAQRLVSIVGEVMVLGLQGIVVPVFSRVQNDHEALKRGLFTAHRLLAFLAFPAFAGVALVARELVPLLLGPKWIEAVPIVRAAAAASLVYAMGFFLSDVLTALGRPGRKLALILFQATLSIAAVLAVIRLGPAAVALAMAGAAFATYIVNALMLRRLIGLDLVAYHRQSLVAALSTGAMAAAVWASSFPLADAPLIVAAAVKIALGAAVYGISTALIARRQWREIFELVRALRGTAPGLRPGAAAD